MANIKKPETQKQIEIDGRKFILKKMDARTGSFLLYRLMKILAPVFKNVNLDQLKDDNIDNINLTELASSLLDLSEDEFRYIQDHALYFVDELYPAGPMPVFNKNGDWGSLDIEFNMTLVMNLTIQSLMYTMKDFFTGSPLVSLMKGLTISQ